MQRRGAPERILGFLLLAFALSSCGTFVSKITGPDNQQDYWLGLGHPYEGVTGDVLTVKCTWEKPAPHVSLRWLVTFFIILDLPLSLIADTLVLPIDLVVKPQRSRLESGDCDANPRSL